MFEKEAEEYTSNILKGVNCNIGNPRARHINSIDVECAFKDGAEFGYNKANEWHYVKDGLPSENAMLLLARKTVNGVQALIGYYKSNQFEIFNEKSCKMQNIDSVYAWKEIVLPELKESE
jgi:hypothetical protein